MATHSSVLAWRIPGMGEPGGLPSMGSHRVGHDWSDLAAAAAEGWTRRLLRVQLLPLWMKELITVCVCVCVCVCVHSVMSRLLRPWNFPGNNTELKWSEVKVAQSCLILCNPMDYTVHGILQARILEWVAVPFSRGSSLPRDRTQVSHTAGGFFTSWILKQVAISFSRVSSQPRDWTHVSCVSRIGRRILYQLSHREGPVYLRGNNCFQSQMYVSNYWN